jgi:hypothetical protein
VLALRPLGASLLRSTYLGGHLTARYRRKLTRTQLGYDDYAPLSWTDRTLDLHRRTFVRVTGCSTCRNTSLRQDFVIQITQVLAYICRIVAA